MVQSLLPSMIAIASDTSGCQETFDTAMLAPPSMPGGSRSGASPHGGVVWTVCPARVTERRGAATVDSLRSSCVCLNGMFRVCFGFRACFLCFGSVQGLFTIPSYVLGLDHVPCGSSGKRPGVSEMIGPTEKCGPLESGLWCAP